MNHTLTRAADALYLSIAPMSQTFGGQYSIQLSYGR